MRIIGIIPLIALALSSCGDRRVSTSPKNQATGRDVLYVSATGEIASGAFSRMAWIDVAPTLAGISRRGLSGMIAEQLRGNAHPPARYMAGLLYLGESLPSESIAIWATLDASEIPPDFLYAPWRLQRSLDPNVANLYSGLLENAVGQGRVRPLIQARFHVTQQAFPQALEAFLQSDPAEWASVDLRGLYQLNLYGPTRADTRLLIAAALKGEALSDELRQPMTTLLHPTEKQTSTELRAALGRALRDNPKLRQRALDAATHQLELRQAFATSDFAKVISLGNQVGPEEATNETVLLMFLASSQTGKRAQSSGWAMELKRRFPNQEVSQWVNTICREDRVN